MTISKDFSALHCATHAVWCAQRGANALSDADWHLRFDVIPDSRCQVAAANLEAKLLDGTAEDALAQKEMQTKVLDDLEAQLAQLGEEKAELRKSVEAKVGCLIRILVTTRHSEVKFTVVVGFARTDDGHNHRQGATFARANL